MKVYPLGNIDLPVTSVSITNSAPETLIFKVVDFEGSYHAILRRLCYAMFMAVTNYTYLKLRMLGPNDVITVSSTSSRHTPIVASTSSSPPPSPTLPSSRVFTRQRWRSPPNTTSQPCPMPSARPIDKGNWGRLPTRQP